MVLEQKERHGRAARATKKLPAMNPSAIVSGGLRFAVPKEAATEPKPAREPKQKVKNDPRLVAAARELRDRWLEQVNRGAFLEDAQGKYDVSRAIEAKQPSTTAAVVHAIPLPPVQLAA
jgi:hypothetical protein